MFKSNIVKKIIVLLLASIAVPGVISAASETTIITANLGSTISLTTSGTVSINITPTSSGSASSASDTVSVSSNNTSGYTLSLKDSDTVLTLTKGSDTIDNHTGSFDSPSTLANNSWGYRVDGVGSFGSGPTSAETNQANLTGTWAGIKSSSDTDDVLKVTSSVALDDETIVWFGVKADTSKPNGAYTNTVVYTATTNP